MPSTCLPFYFSDLVLAQTPLESFDYPAARWRVRMTGLLRGGDRRTSLKEEAVWISLPSDRLHRHSLLQRLAYANSPLKQWFKADICIWLFPPSCLFAWHWYAAAGAQVISRGITKNSWFKKYGELNRKYYLLLYLKTMFKCLSH